jgi:hypothetical protein
MSNHSLEITLPNLIAATISKTNLWKPAPQTILAVPADEFQ